MFRNIRLIQHLLLGQLLAVPIWADSVTLSPAPLNFGDRPVSTPAILLAQLSNDTKKPLNISGISATGSFSVHESGCPTVLSAGNNCFISILFFPTETVSYTGTLTVTDDYGDGTQKVKLSGTGVP